MGEDEVLESLSGRGGRIEACEPGGGSVSVRAKVRAKG